MEVGCEVRVLSYCFSVIEKRGERAVVCVCSVAVLGTVTGYATASWSSSHLKRSKGCSYICKSGKDDADRRML